MTVKQLTVRTALYWVLAALFIGYVVLVAGCKPTGEPKPPERSHSGIVVQPTPGWATGMDEACWTLGAPVALSCVDGPAPRCVTEDGYPGTGVPCWWVDPDTGNVWFRPGADS